MSLLTKATLGLFLFFNHPSFGSPQGPMIFCETYSESPACQNGKVDCTLCHQVPPVLNPYGQNLQKIIEGQDFVSSLPEALLEIQKKDSDQDSISNGNEIAAGSAPGDPQSTPKSSEPKSGLKYNHSWALKRVKGIFCGTMPTYEQIQQVKKSNQPKQHIHKELDTCLQSEYWTEEALHRLADKKIRPVFSVGKEGDVVIGDYKWDYRLFAHIMSGDRDARELLTADYHIDLAGKKVSGRIAREEPATVGSRIVIAGGQPLTPSRRMGMITTQWFISTNTMFAKLPRTTAAQAYRAYLGKDLAKNEGIIPIENEPRDVDNAKVKPKECAVCHSTLDPLAYAFSPYRGIDPVSALITNSIGTYNSTRTPWEGDGAIFGQPVDNMEEWVDVAIKSDEFKQNLARDIWFLVFGRNPVPSEEKEFQDLWQGLEKDNFNINKMIHRLIDTMAFGGTA